MNGLPPEKTEQKEEGLLRKQETLKSNPRPFQKLGIHYEYYTALLV